MDDQVPRDSGPVLRGRASECARLDELLSAVRRGESCALVVRGEAGMGKSDGTVIVRGQNTYEL
jgi:predicted ATPase